jgi:hypothetical protein
LPTPKPLPEKNQIEKMQQYIQATWQLVRRNHKYRQDLEKFCKNSGVNPEEIMALKEKGRLSRHSCQAPKLTWDSTSGCLRWEEKPDPEKCNLSYMVQKWGFVDHPDNPNPMTGWAGFLYPKDERKKMETGVWLQPLLVTGFELQQLPGVLKVVRLPEVAVKLSQDKEPENEWELLYNLQWEVESPPLLTVNVNLQAPLWLVQYSLALLVAAFKAL